MFAKFFSKTYHRRRLETLLELNRHLLKGKILDIGSKNRRYDHLVQGTVTAIDRNANSSASVEYGNIDERLPYPDGSFDGILCIEVLEYVRDLPHALGEIHRLLVPHGYVFMSIPFLYHEHDDRVRYTLSFFKEHLNHFSSFECWTIGNGWTVIGDVILKKSLSSKDVWKRLPAMIVVVCYDMFVSMLRLDRAQDVYYSGIFVVARK